MTGVELQEGRGFFEFIDKTTRAARSIRVFYFRPRTGSRIVIAMHGVDRAAAEFRDVLVAAAERNGQIILVPEFDLQRFPDVYAYNFGGVRLPPPSNVVFPRETWNFGLIERLFHSVQRAVSLPKITCGFFGNSAGAQYVLRCLALTDAVSIDIAVASNSGIYMLPDLARDYPTGMGGIHLDDGGLRRFLSKHLILLLGAVDTDITAPDLPRGDIAIAQGPHRLARGLWYFDHCRNLAARLGVSFGWQLEIVPDAGHISQLIFDRASDLLVR